MMSLGGNDRCHGESPESFMTSLGRTDRCDGKSSGSVITLLGNVRSDGTASERDSDNSNVYF